MPKTSYFPTLFDECKKVTIAELKKYGYLQPDQFLSGVLTWRRGGEKTGSISIVVNTCSSDQYILFDYKSNGNPINYKAQIVSVPSNLGKGFVKYFRCPLTGKLCRNLYLGATYFYHRSAFKGCMYDIQTQSHKNRFLIGQLIKSQKSEKAYEALYSKNFRKTYKGRPTRKYLKVLNQIQAGEGISLEALIMS